MNSDSESDSADVFTSDLIDLSDVNLAAVRDLPSTVLRAAVKRFCAELADNTETSAFFQNSLHGTETGRRAPGAPRESRHEN